jgi:ceramide glucosyltransferase
MDWRLFLIVILSAFVLGKTVFCWLAGAAAVFAGLFALASAAAAVVLLGRRRAPAKTLPPVTVLKPLKGAEPGLYENLASFCDQDYPLFQILFAVAEPDDPALAVVARLRRDRPDCDMDVAVSSGRIGCNPKINNIANAYPLAKHGLLLLSDSDIRVPPDLLRRCAAALAVPGTGLVTCFYRCAPARGLWAALEELCVNAHFLPQALLAGACGMRFAMGAATMVRRDVFDRMGGFGALADHLADDFALGELVRQAGLRLAFADAVVDSMTPEAPRFSEVFRHQVRWQRTVRLCNPAGYLGSGVLHGFSLATLALLLFGWDPRLAAAAAALLAAKAAAAWAIQGLAGRRQRLSVLAWLPLCEWLSFGAWLSGFSSGAVLWRGRRYRVLPRGRLEPVALER